MKVTNIATLKASRAALTADLKAVFAKYGMDFDGYSATVAPTEIAFRMKVKIGGAEKIQEVAEQEYKRWAAILKLPADGFGARYMIGGEMFKVVGVQPNKPKNCVSLLRVKDGKSFQCPSATLRDRVA